MSYWQNAMKTTRNTHVNERNLQREFDSLQNFPTDKILYIIKMSTTFPTLLLSLQDFKSRCGRGTEKATKETYEEYGDGVAEAS